MIGAEAAPLHGRQWWLRAAVYLALCVLGAAFSNIFIRQPDEVTLIWPPSGVAYALLLYHGLRWWPTILIGQALAHLLVAPIPLAFWPFSLASCSFGYLKRLDVDHFKIDRSFIREITRSELSEAIVRSIVEIARVLGRKTTAEWVEDSETIERLRELGVDYGQGHACHRPQPLRDITREALRRPQLAPRAQS